MADDQAATVVTFDAGKLIEEPAIEPDLPIIDTHLHYWHTPPVAGLLPYPPEAYAADVVASGHNVISSVYTDAHVNFRDHGPKAFRCVGETEYVNTLAEAFQAKGGRFANFCAGIVTSADLLLGTAVGEVLDAHIAASHRFRGIRYMTAFVPGYPPVLGAPEGGIMMRPEFRAGAKELFLRDLSFDSWLTQNQLVELLDLLKAFPNGRVVVNHFGGPIAVGPYKDRAEEAFADWKRDLAAIAGFPNVTLKLGGINMPHSGLAAKDLGMEPTSEATAELQRRHILTAIDIFGPDRCMFESNAPIDLYSISFGVIWNSFKRATADLAASERRELFAGTAIRAYRLRGVVLD